MKYDPITELNASISIGDQKAAMELIATNSDLEAVDSMGRSPLMLSIVDCLEQLTTLLISKNVNVNAKDQNHWTALHFAAQNYSTDVCSWLVDAGANVNCQNSNGNTPLILALVRSAGRSELQEYLISKGADRFVNNNSNKSYAQIIRLLS